MSHPLPTRKPLSSSSTSNTRRPTASPHELERELQEAKEALVAKDKLIREFEGRFEGLVEARESSKQKYTSKITTLSTQLTTLQTTHSNLLTSHSTLQQTLSTLSHTHTHALEKSQRDLRLAQRELLTGQEKWAAEKAKLEGKIQRRDEDLKKRVDGGGVKKLERELKRAEIDAASVGVERERERKEWREMGRRLAGQYAALFHLFQTLQQGARDACGRLRASLDRVEGENVVLRMELKATRESAKEERAMRGLMKRELEEIRGELEERRRWIGGEESGRVDDGLETNLAGNERQTLLEEIEFLKSISSTTTQSHLLQIDSLTTELTTLQTALATSESLASSHELSNARLTTDLTTTRTLLTTLQSSYTSLHSTHALAGERMAKLESEILGLEEEKEEMERKMDKERRGWEERKGVVRRLVEEGEVVKQGYKALEDELTILRTELTTTTQLKQTLSDLQLAHQILLDQAYYAQSEVRELGELNASLNGMRVEGKERVGYVMGLRGEVGGLRDTLVSTKTQLQHAHSKISSLQSELATYKSTQIPLGAKPAEGRIVLGRSMSSANLGLGQGRGLGGKRVGRGKVDDDLGVDDL